MNYNVTASKCVISTCRREGTEAANVYSRIQCSDAKHVFDDVVGVDVCSTRCRRITIHRRPTSAYSSSWRRSYDGRTRQESSSLAPVDDAI